MWIVVKNWKQFSINPKIVEIVKSVKVRFSCWFACEEKKNGPYRYAPHDKRVRGSRSHAWTLTREFTFSFPRSRASNAIGAFSNWRRTITEEDKTSTNKAILIWPSYVPRHLKCTAEIRSSDKGGKWGKMQPSLSASCRRILAYPGLPRETIFDDHQIWFAAYFAFGVRLRNWVSDRGA